MKNNQKVLVLGHEMRSTLSVIRSLGRGGLEVHLGTDFSEPALCKYSKYITETHYFPSVRDNMDHFIDALLKHVGANKYELVIPTTDIFMVPLVRCRNEIEPDTPLAAPNDKAFWTAYNKFLTVKLASSLNIPVPVSKRIDCQSKGRISFKPTDFPKIIKPFHTQLVVNKSIHHYGVKMARDKAEYETVLADYLCVTPVLVQDFFIGTGIGVEVICFDGEVLVAFQHRRVHEPFHGGGSSYRMSVSLNPELLDYSKRLMASLQWTGVAMVEFLLNDLTEKSVLVEINGRFWGSLPLALKAGIDFPVYLYQMLVEGKKSFPVKYRENIYCRNLVNDFWWLYSNVRAPSKDPYLKTVPLPSLMKESKNIFLLKEYNDTFDLHDIRPGLLEIKHCLRDILDLIKKRIRSKFYRFLERIRLADWWFGCRRVISAIKNVQSVLFICKGNICRSPFGEKYLQRKSNVKSRSAGYYPRINRTPPKKALMISQSFQIDLSKHLSSHVTKRLIDDADLVFVMDLESYLELLHTFPWGKRKFMFLSWFRKEKGPLSIPDPLDFSLPLFKEVYDDIARCIDNFLITLEG